MRPDLTKYSVTTREPGASEVLTQGGVVRPFSTAFFATRPAASMTEGFEVLVQLVIAAITTEPFETASLLVLEALGKASRKFLGTAWSSTRSCGRLGPAMDGVTAARSRSRLSE